MNISGNLFKRGFKSNAENLSIEYRTNLGLKAWEPLCAFKLAQFLEVTVISPSSILDSESDIRQLCGDGVVDSGWSALTMTNSLGKRIIIHNTKHSSPRQQSNLMHEIAHIICDHKIPPQYTAMSLPFAMPYNDKHQEAEAAYLGAALQLSKACLFWGLKRNMTYTQMAEHYNASIEMVTYRINASGVARQKGIVAKRK